jgi:hypothetical protein
MKNAFSIALTAGLAILASAQAFALAPPSDFILRRMQLQAILDEPAVQERFGYEAIDSIRYVGTERVGQQVLQRFVLNGSKCTAEVFVGNASVGHSDGTGLPGVSLSYRAIVGECK